MKLDKPWLFWIEKKVAGIMLRLLDASIRSEIKGSYFQEPAIYALWHRNLLPLLLKHKDLGVAVVISSSKDGELIAGPAQELGFLPVRGSTTRGGDKAFKELLRCAKTRSLAITPDGPKGPSEKIQGGLLHLAYLTKLPIILVAADLDKEWVFHSWDRFRVPKPFATVKIQYSEPIYITEKEQLNTMGEILQQRLDEMTVNLQR